MTSIIGLDFMAFQARDLVKSVQYYVNVFGFEKAPMSPPGAVVFNTAPVPFALREPLRPLPPTGPLGTGAVAWFSCQDADKLHQDIVSKGGKVLTPVSDGPFGRFFAAADPDGYVLTFHTAK